MGRAIMVAIAVAFGVTDLAAQTPLPVMTGQRIRVWSPSVSGEFVFRGVQGDSVMLGIAHTDETKAVPVGSITRLDMHAGQRSRSAGFLRGLGYGFLAGAVSGGVIGFADGDSTCGRGELCIIEMSAGEKAAILGIGFGALGGAIGGAIGAARPGQRWQRTSMASTVSVTPTIGRGVGLSVRKSF